VFKKAAAKVDVALKEAGYEVSINAEKPRKGSFVVKIDGADEPAINLLDMPRPFKKLRELDVEAAIAKAIDA